jgi:hypothetical protein
MGVSVNGAFKIWEKKSKTFVRPRIDDSFSYDDFEDGDTQETNYLSLLIHSYGYTCMGKFHEPGYNQEKFNYHIKKSNDFFNSIENLEETDFKGWLLKHKGKMIYFDYDCFHVASELESYERDTWTYSDYLRCNEDGRILFNTFLTINHYFHVDLGVALISQDEIDYYDPEESTSLDEKIATDLAPIVEKAEHLLQVMVKSPFDEFFEERKERLQLIVDVMKQGGRFIYSV